MSALRESARGATKAKKEPLQVWKAGFFKALAHSARIRLPQYLQQGEKPAGEIIEALGLEQSNDSQHLGGLRNKNIVVARPEGASVCYMVRYPMLFRILDLLRQCFHEHLSEVRVLLEALEEAPNEDLSAGA